MAEVESAVPKKRKVQTDPGGFLRPYEHAVTGTMTVTEPEGPFHFVKLRDHRGVERYHQVKSYDGLTVHDVVTLSIEPVMVDALP